MKIDCKEIAAKAKEQIERACKNKNLKFGIIQVGDNQASNIYIKGKMKDCAEVGIETTIFKYQENITQSSLSEKLNFLVKSNTFRRNYNSVTATGSIRYQFAYENCS